MKRVANKIAVQSFLYTVRGDQLLRIIDYPTRSARHNADNGVIAFDDNICAIYSDECEKLRRAELLGTSIEVNMWGHPVLILEVCTNDEEY